MATVVRTKASKAAQQSTKTGDAWTAIFPARQDTRLKSAVLVKKLLAVSISSVAYLRALLPESAFSERTLVSFDSKTNKNATTNLRILRDDSQAASQLIRWLRGCFDALDKNYLKAFILGVCTDPNEFDSALETYTFEFNYTEAAFAQTGEAAPSNASSFTMFHNKNASNVQSLAENQSATYSTFTAPAAEVSSEDVRLATTRLLRTLIVLTQAVDALPADRPLFLAVRLLYHDAITPHDYQPEGFGQSAGTFAHKFETVTIKAGEVSTSFHNFKCKVVTDKRLFESEEMTENADNERQDSDQTAFISVLDAFVQMKSFSLKMAIEKTQIDAKNLKNFIERALKERLIEKAKRSGFFNANVETIVDQYKTCAESDHAKQTIPAKKLKLDDFEISNSQPSNFLGRKKNF